jgi:hypothetical protein
VPAAAVIPAPIAYVKIAAVKKLVVGFLAWCAGPAIFGLRVLVVRLPSFGSTSFAERWRVAVLPIIYFEKIRVFKAGYTL